MRRLQHLPRLSICAVTAALAVVDAHVIGEYITIKYI